MEIHPSDEGSLRSLKIDSRGVHVWRASLRQHPAVVQQLHQTLSQDEAERAARFHFEDDRDAFIVARGILRWLLAGYVTAEPHQLTFWYEPAGKPHLSNSFAGQIYFNVSHSRDMALFAISHQPKIGIDIEYIRPVTDMAQIARSTFSPNENAQLQSIPHHLTSKVFFDCWTRKEAFVKALGSGFSFPLQDFDVSITPGQAASLLRVAGSESEAARWSMYDLEVSPEYAAAIVIEGNGHSIVQQEWTSLMSTLTL
jgi:4'-phosphopantetheinyl transferase